MKKRLVLIFALIAVIIAAPILMVGCGEDKSTPWTDCYNRLVKFLGEDTNKVSYTNEEISYKGNLNDVVKNKDSYPSYYELKGTYEPLLKLAFADANKYYGQFKVSPTFKVDDKMKDLALKLNAATDKAARTIKDFVEIKTNYENSIIGDYNDIVALRQLTEFKREYSKLISAALDFSDAFENAYSYMYFNFENAISDSGEILNIQNLENLIISGMTSHMLRPIYEYQILEFNSDFNQDRFGFDLVSFMDFYKKEKTFITEGRREKISFILEVNKMFKSEKIMLSQALTEVNLNEIYEIYNGDVEAFKQSNPKNRAYYNKIYVFFNETLNIVKNSLEGIVV